MTRHLALIAGALQAAALLEMVLALACTGTAVALFPVVRRVDEATALGLGCPHARSRDHRHGGPGHARADRSGETPQRQRRSTGRLHDVTLTACLNSTLRDAMRRRDAALVMVLRSTLAALANAQAVPHSGTGDAGSARVAGAARGVGATEVQRRPLSHAEQRAIVVSEIRELAAQASHLEDAGRAEEANDVRRAKDELASLLAECTDQVNG